MTFGIKIFGDSASRVLDSRFKSYSLISKSLSLNIPSGLTYQVNSEGPPLAFIRPHTEGACVVTPLYENLGGNLWSVTIELAPEKTVPWNIASTIAPVTWNGEFPPFQYNNNSDQAFPNSTANDMTGSDYVIDLYTFGIEDDNLVGEFGAAMFDEVGSNPFVMTEAPLVTVKSIYLDPRSWEYSGGTSQPTYTQNQTGSYIDHTKITPDGNYSKIAELPTSIAPDKAAISPGSFVLVTEPVAKTTWRSMLAHVFRYVSGHFIIGPTTGVAIIDHKLTTWTGNFWRCKNETQSNDPLIDYVTVLVIDTDMYI